MAKEAIRGADLRERFINAESGPCASTSIDLTWAVPASPRPPQSIFYRLRPASEDVGTVRDPWIAPEDHPLLVAPKFPPFFKFPGWRITFALLGFGIVVELLCTVFAHKMAVAFGSASEGDAVRKLLVLLSIPITCIIFTYAHICTHTVAIELAAQPVAHIRATLHVQGLRCG
jgi:hypothetical protein